MMIAGATLALVWGMPVLCAAFVEQPNIRESSCPSAQTSVAAFHAELNAGSAKDLNRLANTAEAAARLLILCADSKSIPEVINRDRLRVRAADALFIAAEARSRKAQHRRQVTDLKRVLRLVADLDPAALTSNEHLYQEARVLQRLTERIIGKAQS